MMSDSHHSLWGMKKMTSTVQERLARNEFTLIAEMGVNYYDIASKLNISVAALSRYEKGSFEPKSLALIVDLAMLYKVLINFVLKK